MNLNINIEQKNEIVIAVFFYLRERNDFMYKKFRMFFSPEDDGGASSGIETSEQSNNNQQSQVNNQTQDQQSQTDTKSYTQEDIAKLQEKFETDKQAAIEEALKKAKMTADEKAKYEQETKLKEIEEREKQIALRELKADAMKILAQKNIPSNMLDFLVGEDLEKTKLNIDSFKVEFDKALQTQLEERLKGKAPSLSNINSNNTISEQFKKALG